MLGPQKGFRHVLERFSEAYPGKILLDSSKSISFFEDYYLNYIYYQETILSFILRFFSFCVIFEAGSRP
ncbi:MAG: hypothetical protein KatS3mg081_0016 [Gemmatimonadales bacterium]|nr:MAG: hypothetical protein KatS3mg081_0016 [Gemmatimonadales bacterium]